MNAIIKGGETLEEIGERTEAIRATFLHIPKTGGRTIRAVFDVRPGFCGIDHGGDSPLYDKTIRNAWDDLGFVFTFVRNPYDRLISAYSHGCIRKHWTDFEEFILSPLGLEQDYRNKIIVIRPIISWLDGLPPVATFYYEDFERHFRAIGKLFGLPDSFKIPRMNQHPHPPFRSVYTEKMAEIVYRFFEADFIRFGYDRDSWK